MELEFLNEFETLAKSGEVDAALREPNFVNRAIKLFDLREKLWKTFNRSEEKVENDGEAEAQRRARTPGRVAFAAGAVICGALIASPVMAGLAIGTLAASLVTIGLGGFAMLAVGGIGCWIARSIMKAGPRSDAEGTIERMAEQRKTLHARIEREIDSMDSQLVTQTPQVREEFRAAFRHASLKEEARLNKIHRAKVEQEAEEAADAAQTAATMSTIAAVNSATAAMRR